MSAAAFHAAHTDDRPWHLAPPGDCDVCDDIRAEEARDDERMVRTGCLLDHEALKRDPRGWARCLRTQLADAGIVDVRYCWRCGTTLAREVRP